MLMWWLVSGFTGASAAELVFPDENYAIGNADVEWTTVKDTVEELEDGRTIQRTFRHIHEGRAYLLDVLVTDLKDPTRYLGNLSYVDAIIRGRAGGDEQPGFELVDPVGDADLVGLPARGASWRRDIEQLPSQQWYRIVPANGRMVAVAYIVGGAEISGVTPSGPPFAGSFRFLEPPAHDGFVSNQEAEERAVIASGEAQGRADGAFVVRVIGGLLLLGILAGAFWLFRGSRQSGALDLNR